jgi:hypothetical protein
MWSSDEFLLLILQTSIPDEEVRNGEAVNYVSTAV